MVTSRLDVHQDGQTSLTLNYSQMTQVLRHLMTAEQMVPVREISLKIDPLNRQALCLVARLTIRLHRAIAPARH